MKRKPPLSLEQVEDIRNDTVSTQLELAIKYRVTVTTIYRIQRGLSHKNVGHVQASESISDPRLDTVIELLETLVTENHRLKESLTSIEDDIQGLRKYLKPVVDRVAGS